MRARNLKPSFFKNELLATTDPIYGWVFAGLWCLADRGGRLEDRPRRIHLEINAGRAFETTDHALGWLAENGFITRYEHNKTRYLQVINFAKHQNPHVREPQSSIPAPCEHSAYTVQGDAQHESGPADSPSLIPDSPSLIPEGKSARATHSPTAPAGEVRQKRGSRIPAPFLLTPEMRAWAKSETPDVDVEFETKEFADYWRTVPGQKGCKLDWVLTWQVRLREIQRRAKSSRRFNGNDATPKLTWRPPPDEDSPNAPE